MPFWLYHGQTVSCVWWLCQCEDFWLGLCTVPLRCSGLGDSPMITSGAAGFWGRGYIQGQHALALLPVKTELAGFFPFCFFPPLFCVSVSILFIECNLILLSMALLPLLCAFFFFFKWFLKKIAVLFFGALENATYSSLVHLFPIPGISTFSKQLWLLLLENGIRTQDLSAGCAYWGWVVPGTGPYHAVFQTQNDPSLVTFLFQEEEGWWPSENGTRATHASW